MGLPSPTSPLGVLAPAPQAGDAEYAVHSSLSEPRWQGALLIGPPGIGKTRTIDEAIDHFTGTFHIERLLCTEHLAQQPYGSLQLLVAGGIAFPDWLLQGLGRFATFSALLACGRLVALAGLLLTVRSADDVAWALAWQVMPLGLSALGAWMVLARHGSARWTRPGRRSVRFALADGKHLFVGNIAHMSMGAVNTVVPGAVAGPVQAAYFGAAERFGNAGRGVMGGVSVAMLPRMTRALDDPDGAPVRRLLTVGIAGGYVLGGASLAVLAPLILPWYLGPGFTGAVPLAQLIGLALCVAGGCVVLNLRAAAEHRFRAIARVTTAAALFHLALIGPASLLLGGTGAALTVVASETLLLVLFFDRPPAPPTPR